MRVGGKDTLISSILDKNLHSLKKIANLMSDITGDEMYKESIEKQEIKLKDNKKLPSNIVINSMIENKQSFYEYCMENVERQKLHYNSLDIESDMIKKLEKEREDSLEKKRFLESEMSEDYEKYIDNYFLD